MRLRALTLLLLLLPAVLVPGGLVESYCAALCCAEEVADTHDCCGGESSDGLTISEIPACCLDDVSWVTPTPPNGIVPEARLDWAPNPQGGPLFGAFALPATGRRFEAPPLRVPPDLPDWSRSLPLLI